MKIWKILSPCLLVGLLLTGCQKGQLPENPLDLYEDWFGKAERQVVRACGLKGENWEKEESELWQLAGDSTQLEYDRSIYRRTLPLEGGGTLETTLQFLDTDGLAAFNYKATSLPVSRTSLYQGAMEFYTRCVELFGEPALSTDEKKEAARQQAIARPTANSLLIPPQTVGLDWTEYGDINAFYAATASQQPENMGQPDAYQLKSYWWDASDTLPFTRVDVSVRYEEQQNGEMTVHYSFTCQADVIGWDIWEIIGEKSYFEGKKAVEE